MNSKQLHSHFRDCSHQKSSVSIDDSWNNLPVLDTTSPFVTTSSPSAPSLYTYVRVPVRGSPDGKTLLAVGDTGASRCIISERALREFFPNATVDRSVTNSIIGVGRQSSTGWADITAYFKGRVNGKDSVARFQLGCWIVPKLDAGLLISQEFLVPHRCDVLGSQDILRFGCFDNDFDVPIEQFKQGPSQRYRARLADNAVLGPYSRKMVPIRTGASGPLNGYRPYSLGNSWKGLHCQFTSPFRQ